MQVRDLAHRLGGVREGGAFVSTQLVRRWFDEALPRTGPTTDFAGLFAELARARAESQADRSSTSRWSPVGTRGPHSFLRDHFDYLAEMLERRRDQVCPWVRFMRMRCRIVGLPREDRMWFG